MTGARQPDRRAALSAIFVRLLGPVTDDVDVIELLDDLAVDCVSLFAVHAAGLLLGDRHGALHVVASSDERPELVELLESQAEQGPCRDCLRTGAPVAAPDLDDPQTGRRWPQFTARARSEGFHAAHVLPMRLSSRTVGALNLLGEDAGRLEPDELRAAQALADAAAVGIVTERTARSGAAALDQLRTTIAGRAVVEQAKGVLAERGNLDVADAFARLRDHAHRTGQRLTELAGRVIDGTLDTATLLGPDNPR